MLKLQDDSLSDTSAAVLLTVESPIANRLPEGGTQVTVTPGQLSETAGAKVATAPAGLVASTTIRAGQVITGACVSWTVTVNVQGAEAEPDEFVA